MNRTSRTGMYYNFDRLMGFYPMGFRIFIAVGEGGVGKTYSAFQLCKNKLNRKADRKMLLVRDAENVVDAFNSEDGKGTLEKHFCKNPDEVIKMEKDDLWLCDKIIDEKLDKEGNPYEIERLIPKRHLGAMAALSTFYKNKGVERAEAGYDIIYMDEFIPESRQADRIDTVRAFYRTLQSTLRTNPNAVVILTANLVNESPLWEIFGCKPGKPGEITFNAETGVVIEHVVPTPEWVKAHEASVAGRLGINDYNRDKRINPNIRPLHLESGVFYTMNMCRKMTTDGSHIVWVFSTEQMIKEPRGYYRRFYCCSNDVGQEIYNKHISRGMRLNASSRVTSFGYVRRPKSYFDPLASQINEIIFDSRNTLEKFEIICK